MLVRCVTDQARDLPPNPVLYTRESKFHVVPGNSYEVYGISLYAGSLGVLICDETGRPDWYPLQLFTVESHELPEGWWFRVVDERSPYLQALWGYHTLIDDEDHYDKLLERDPDALRIFLEQGSK